jgi:hypothetical protein
MQRGIQGSPNWQVLIALPTCAAAHTPIYSRPLLFAPHCVGPLLLPCELLLHSKQQAGLPSITWLSYDVMPHWRQLATLAFHPHTALLLSMYADRLGCK